MPLYCGFFVPKENILLWSKDLDKLLELATVYTEHLLTIHNNQLDQKHRESIKMIIEGLISQLEGDKCKLAFPLFCGGGKTTCIRGFLFALDGLNLNYSVVVSATQIEALCELKRSLIEDGIPEEKIGLVHSKQFHPDKIGYDGYASLPSNTEEEIENAPFVLVTHNKIKHQKTCIESYYYYQGKKRDLVIWDESLLSGEASYLSVLKICNSIDSALNGFEHKIQGKSVESHYSTLIEYLKRIDGVISKIKNIEDVAIKFPELPMEPYKLNEQLNELLIDNDGDDLKKLFEFLNNEGEIRYIKESQGAFIHFRPTLPEELDRIVILDASHSLRELTQSDQSIKTIEMDCPKSYENLSINYFKSGAGRSSVEKKFFKKENSKLVDEIIEIINSILTESPNEAILIWTYKPRKNNKSIEKAIKRRLVELNPNLNISATNEKGEKILNFNTFGNELGLNGLTHCKHSIFCGLLYKPRAYLAGMLKGLSKDMNRAVFENKLLQKTEVSEQAHIFYQAVSRGSSRLTEDGRCQEHRVYFFHSKPLALKRMLNDVFPQAKWRRYQAVYLDNKNSFYYETANKINDLLNSLAESDFLSLNPRTKKINEVSTQILRNRFFAELERHQWSNSIRVFKEEFPWDWEIKGQSFITTG